MRMSFKLKKKSQESNGKEIEIKEFRKEKERKKEKLY